MSEVYNPSQELFGRQERQDFNHALLIHPEMQDDEKQEFLQEFIELAESAGAKILQTLVAKRKVIDSKTFIGSGKAEEVADLIKLYNENEDSQVDIVIVNQQLSPSQERNLERIFQCRVIDRVGLILDIFAQRARTHEGKLQVELAQLKHMQTRLVRGWTHLERQKGGIGLRGPGETQLETDRRLLAERVKYLEKRIEKVRNQRQLSRRARSRNRYPIITLVGYTNAGKSTLFNHLTSAEVYAENRLFATLDATVRKLNLPGLGDVMLVDTVGFIRHIPHDLVAAFRSTLEETLEADLLIHLLDGQTEDASDKLVDVFKVLEEIGAQKVPQLLVINKIDDAADAQLQANVAYLSQTARQASAKMGIDVRQILAISSITGNGMLTLKQTLASYFEGALVDVCIELNYDQGKMRAHLYTLGEVLGESPSDDKIRLQLRLTQGALQDLKALDLTLCQEPLVESQESYPVN